MMKSILIAPLLVLLLSPTSSTAQDPGSPPVRLAVAGLTHDHVHWIFNRPGRGDVELVGIYEPNRALVQRYARRYDLEADLFFDDLGEMLDAVKPEVVTAFGSIHDHLSVVEAAAPRGVHVMVEKPLAVTQQIKPDIYPKVDDEATIIVTYPQTQGIIQASWNWSFNRKDMQVYGQTGYIYAMDGQQLRVRQEGQQSEEELTLEPRSAPFDDPFSYLAAVVRGQVEVTETDLSSLANNVTVVRILDAARESAKTGKTVYLDDQ